MFWKKITTNPPAREISLANRKKTIEKKVRKEYNEIIKDINCAIKRGNLSTDIYLGTSYSKKYGKSAALMFLALRKIRKDGFKVCIDKQIKQYNYYLSDGSHVRDESIVRYTRNATVSW